MRILRCLLIVALLLTALAAAVAQDKPPSPTSLADPTPWTGAPAVLRVSDAVRPGTLFFLSGEGLAKLEVVAASGICTAPPKTAIPARVSYVDHKGQFAIVEMPKALKPGQFSLWVTKSGQEAPPTKVIHMNLPRPQWLSQPAAWAGQEVRLIGYNLLGSEFGAKDLTAVRLLPARGKAVAAKLLEANPFAVKFALPQAAPGEYRVEVSNDGGGNWVPVPDALRVVPVGKDPLGLGVAWANDFHWERRFPVRPPTADCADDTPAIQAAIAQAKAAGGGVVFLPAGEYRVNSLQVPSGIVLLGEGPQKTVLNYLGSGAAPINSAGDGTVAGLQGVARLGIKVEPGKTLPDCFIIQGQQWGAAAGDVSLRTATRMFIHDVSVDYDLKTPIENGHRGLGPITIGRELCLIDHCRFRGYYAPPHRTLLNQYVWVHDNFMEFSNGTFVTTAARALVESNHLIGHRENVPDEARNPSDIHGIFARDHLYAADNLIEGMGIHEGEAICVEPPGAFVTYGKVLSAEGKQMTLESAVPYDWSKLELQRSISSAWHVVIVGGRGLGQYRRVTAAAGNAISVDREWDLLPDASSLFSIILPNDHVIMYHNTARDCTKGFWFYGNVIDGVAADNVSDNAEGVFSNAYHTPDGTFSMIYFIRNARNVVRGVSPRTQHAGVGFATSRTSLFTPYGVHSLGMEIRDNEIVGVPATKPFAGSECPTISGLFGVFYSGYEGSEACDRVGTIFENNRLKNLNVGITIGRDNCGTVLRGNTLTNVTTPVEDRKSKNLVQE